MRVVLARHDEHAGQQLQQVGSPAGSWGAVLCSSMLPVCAWEAMQVDEGVCQDQPQEVGVAGAPRLLPCVAMAVMESVLMWN
jgi:hypothetical protein